MPIIRMILLLLVFCCIGKVYGQTIQQAEFNKLGLIVKEERSVSRLTKRLDTLLKHYMPSRSQVVKNIHRPLDVGFYHIRYQVSYWPMNYFINMLVRNDSVFMLTAYSCEDLWRKASDYKDAPEPLRLYQYDSVGASTFLRLRNRIYGSKKTLNDLVNELSANTMYAMNCGFANQLTSRGKYIHALIEEENSFPEIARMLQHLLPEEQAYGVTAIDILLKRGVDIDDRNYLLYQHIRKRNTAVYNCFGCLAGLVEPLYNN
ncbi:hypothetical protein [Chitinophaga flava]|uniref:Uncharacterized protein n=1 Tax=Chitinophaga flava TaxID=2259036 RepID=A0A365XUU1_9BACT|nr:hypothetical protein [Chitinophaga flava]RBL89365.1 hypothetical protein DF182_22860 [Chitinophaga flava]